MTLPHAVRWALVPLGAMGGCAGTLTSTGFIGRIAEHAISSEQMEAVVPLDVRAGMAYAVAAILFVVIGAVVAPKHRIIVAVLLYLLGAMIAWYVLKDWYFPEFHPRGYQGSLVPMWLALCDGMTPVLAVAAWCTQRRVAALPDAHGTR